MKIDTRNFRAKKFFFKRDDDVKNLKNTFGLKDVIFIKLILESLIIL